MADIERKSELVVVRATLEEVALLRRAADVTGKTLSEFLIYAGVELAEEMLTSRVLLRLDDEAWRAFQDILDRPVQDQPRLGRLLAEPDHWPE